VPSESEASNLMCPGIRGRASARIGLRRYLTPRVEACNGTGLGRLRVMGEEPKQNFFVPWLG